MKIIFFCNTHMQLINAIQIKTLLKKDVSADLILSDHSRGAKGIAERLKETKIFDRVLYLKNYREMTYMQSKVEDLKDVVLLCLGKDTKYRNMLWDDVPDYDEIYFYNYDFIIHIVYDEMIKRGISPKLFRYEEGLSGYHPMSLCLKGKLYAGRRMQIYTKFRKAVHKDVLFNKISGDYVYFPEIYREYVGKDFSVHPLPVLSRDRRELVDVLNQIFDYKPEENSIKQKYIYLAGNCDTEGFRVNELDLVIKLAELVGKENLMVKMHPRDNRRVYEDAGFHVNRYSAVPWELVLLGQNFSEHIFVSLCSGSMITGPAIMQEDYEAYYIFPMIQDRLCNGIMPFIIGVDKILEQLHRNGRVMRCKKISEWKEIAV